MTIVTRRELSELLSLFNEQYGWHERNDPRQGYLVQFTVKDHGVEALLHPYGKTRNGKERLSGIAEARDSCLFCPQNLAENPLKIQNLTRSNTTDAVKSLSGQVLIVPKTHYSQWFEAPIELQIDLLQEAIDMRERFPEAQKGPIELHCGSAAGQTVFHIHVRTNVYLK